MKKALNAVLILYYFYGKILVKANYVFAAVTSNYYTLYDLFIASTSAT